MKLLVIAEHHHNQLKPSTLHTVSAAHAIGGDITILVCGQDCQDIAKEAASIDNISNILVCDSPLYAHSLPENLAALIASLAKDYAYILAPATTFGKNFMPRLSALLDCQQISDIISVESQDTFKRPIYAGNAIATVQSMDACKLITVRTTAFAKAAVNPGQETAIESINAHEDTGLSVFKSLEESESERPELTSARVVVSGGRGVASKENFKLIEDLAEKLGGAVGASRVAVDSGYVPNDYQVGQTGKIVAPELYIAVGISGAIQHLAGMKDSKTIVAINTDENAPIFEIADYGLVADLFDAVPELISKV